MSFVNGDKARNFRLRKKRVQLRLRTRKLLETKPVAIDAAVSKKAPGK